MAIGFNGGTDTARITSGGYVAATGAYTITLWVRFTTATTTQTICLVGSGTAYHWFVISDSEWYVGQEATGSFTTASGGSVSAGQWYRVECRYNGTNQITIWVDGVQQASLATVDISATALIEFGNDINAGFTDFLNGRLANAKIFNSNLTADQAAMAHYCYVPSFAPAAWYPLLLNGDLNDYSGNARHLTAGGTLTTEDGPPVSWGGQAWLLPYVVASGTEYDQGAAGTLAPVGAISRTTGKIAAGVLGLAATITRTVTKSATGALTPTGALLRDTAKTLAGTLGLSGAIATTRGYIRSVAGALTPSGALIRAAGKLVAGTLDMAGATARATAKSITGALTPTGALSRLTDKIVAGAVDFAGAFEAELNAGSQEYDQSAGGTLGLAGTAGKLTAKAFAGALTPSGALATLKAVSVVVAGTLGLAGAIVRTTGKVVSGTLTPGGVVARVIAVTRAGALGLAGAVNKGVTKTLGGALTPAGVLDAARTFLASVAGTLGLSGTTSRATSKLVIGAVGLAGDIARATAKSVAGALTFLGTLLASLVGDTTPKLDVAVSHSAVTTLTLVDSSVFTLTVSDSSRG